MKTLLIIPLLLAATPNHVTVKFFDKAKDMRAYCEQLTDARFCRDNNGWTIISTWESEGVEYKSCTIGINLGNNAPRHLREIAAHELINECLLEKHR